MQYMDVIQVLLPAWRALKKNSFSPFDTQVPSQRTLVLNIVNSFKKRWKIKDVDLYLQISDLDAQLGASSSLAIPVKFNNDNCLFG